MAHLRTRTPLLLLTVGLLLASALLTEGCARRETGTARTPEDVTTQSAVPTWPPEVKLLPRWTGFEQPVHLTGAGDGSGRVFVVGLTGIVSVIDGGKVLERPFLDISDKVKTGGERGLFSMAFAPDHAESGRFYVAYTDDNGSTVVERYRVSASDRSVAAPESAQVVLTVPQPQPNHNGGQIAFGPDGQLYVGLGDGGGGGDPRGNAQNPDSLLGKILRIDVSGPGPYAVPANNPFVNRGGYRPEIWDLGLRNPWRFSFDTLTGELFIADVGQNEWEEINVEPVNSGGNNYGWNLYEGSHPYPPGSAASPTIGLVMPTFEYGHDRGNSVTGGYVYRGATWANLVGAYLYADYGSGRIWAAERDGQTWRTALVADTSRKIAGFGQDESGEVYALDISSGEVLSIVSP